ncbi:putative ARF GTPase activator [Aureobasidium sp. EXF-12344]|nr:putative ARF GTPase activator [Aureobasidium sp. EXF-12344]
MSLATKTQSQKIFEKLKQKQANKVGGLSFRDSTCATILMPSRSASIAAPKTPPGLRFPLESISAWTCSSIVSPQPVSPRPGVGFGTTGKGKEKDQSEMERLGMGVRKLGFGQVGGGAPAAAAPKKMGFGSTTRATEEKYARQKFGTQKGISSDEFFGRGTFDSNAQQEAKSRLQGFEGAQSISSNAYFGRPEDEMPEGEYGDIETAAKDFVRKLGITAGDDLENLTSLLGEGTNKLQDWMQNRGEYETDRTTIYIMPPKGSRVVHHDNDSRSDGSSSKTNHNTAKNKRPNGTSNLRDAKSVNDTTMAQNASSSNGFTWAQEDLSLLQQYRAAHRMETPSAFNSIRNQFLLSNPGIGRQSPTMARRKAKRKVPKEQLAMAVRKNFNDAAVNEIDVMVDLLYKVRNQGMSSCNVVLRPVPEC